MVRILGLRPGLRALPREFHKKAKVPVQPTNIKLDRFRDRLRLRFRFRFGFRARARVRVLPCGG